MTEQDLKEDGTTSQYLQSRYDKKRIQINALILQHTQPYHKNDCILLGGILQTRLLLRLCDIEFPQGNIQETGFIQVPREVVIKLLLFTTPVEIHLIVNHIQMDGQCIHHLVYGYSKAEWLRYLTQHGIPIPDIRVAFW